MSNLEMEMLRVLPGAGPDFHEQAVLFNDLFDIPNWDYLHDPFQFVQVRRWRAHDRTRADDRTARPSPCGARRKARACSAPRRAALAA